MTEIIPGLINNSRFGRARVNYCPVLENKVNHNILVTKRLENRGHLKMLEANTLT